MVAQVELPARYPKEQDDLRYYRALTRELANLPGLDAVGLGAPLPFSGSNIRVSLHAPGQPPSTALPGARVQSVSPSYFAAMGIPLIIGRNFDFVLDAVGKFGIRRWRRWLKPVGVFAATDRGPWSQNLLFVLWSKITGNGRVVIPLAKRR